jgi:flagellar biosynthesis GTPase FlhF
MDEKVTTETVEQPAAGEGVTPATDNSELERVRAALKKANAEAAERRLKLEAFEKAEEERKQAEMSELEKTAESAKKAEAKAAQLEAEYGEKVATLTKRLLDSEIKQAAGRPVTDKDGKVTRPAFRPEALDDILLLVDRTVIEDKDGKWEGIEKALAELAKAKAYLLADGQPAAPQKGTPKPQDNKPRPQGTAPAGPTWTL